MSQPLTESAESLRRFWTIDPGVVYLNHGSFGPSPTPVQEAREAWTRRLEKQPMHFFCSELEQELDETEATLATWLRTKPNRIGTIENATQAMNVVAASVELKPDDEVILTDHEYGAVRRIWSHYCKVAGARVVTANLQEPTDAAAVVEDIRQARSPRTRIIIISHVSSATAVVLPVKEVCQMARETRTPVCVDGPHAVAMLDLDLDQLGCDYYCASCHKWLCAPFGSGFLWVHPRHHDKIRSPMISWGGSISGRASHWKDALRWPGTRDPASQLATSAAVAFFHKDRLQVYRQHAHALITRARNELLALDGVAALCQVTEDDYVCMYAVELPRPPGWKPGYHGSADVLQLELKTRFGIEIPVGSWNGRRFMRLSAHLYNTDADFDCLLRALQQSSSLYG